MCAQHTITHIRRFIPDLRIHPGVSLGTYNMPLTISQDDPGLFNTHPLTHDLFAAWMSFGYDISTLKQVCGVVLCSVVWCSAAPCGLVQRHVVVLCSAAFNVMTCSFGVV